MARTKHPKKIIDPRFEGLKESASSLGWFDNLSPSPTSTMPAITTSNNTFAFETKQPGAGRSGAGDFDLLNTVGNSMRYIVPLSRLLGNNRRMKQLEKDSKFTPSKVSLLHGVESGLPRPNFGLRYREPMGSSLSEHVAGQKFADAQQREAERAFNIQDALTRREQRSGIRASKNQETIMNTELENRAKAFNAQNANYERLLRMGQQDELMLGLTETLTNDLTQRNYLKASEKASAAANILRTATPGTDIYNKALKYYMDILDEERSGKKANGGKIKTKTKFSNGK